MLGKAALELGAGVALGVGAALALEGGVGTFVLSAVTGGFSEPPHAAINDARENEKNRLFRMCETVSVRVCAGQRTPLNFAANTTCPNRVAGGTLCPSQYQGYSSSMAAIGR